MKSVISVFPDIELKGCWFYFAKALQKKTFSIGYKSNYVSEWSIRFWVKRFLALALLPIEKLHESIDIILHEMVELNIDLVPFIVYFEKQWLKG